MPESELRNCSGYCNLTASTAGICWQRHRATRRRNAKLSNLIEARNAARKAKNFKESDRIRDELAAMGVVLKDTKDGTTWEIAR